MLEKKKKITFILPSLNAGGAERVLITLMNSLDRNIYDISFITISDEGSLKPLVNNDISFYSLHEKRVLRSLFKLRKQLKEISPDIVMSTMVHMNFTLLLLKPFLTKTKFIVREAVTPTYILETHPNISLFLKFAYKFLYAKADCVISPAQRIIDEFANEFGMPCDNHILLYNPVDLDKIRSSGLIDYSNDKVRDNTVHFVASGRLHYQKGFDRLIEKLPCINLPYDWVVTILGDGEEREKLQELIDNNGLHGKVILAGLKSNPWKYYASADCFIMPSRSEGLPNVTLESLAAGTPVIATSQSGGIAEIKAMASNDDVQIVDNMNEFIHSMEKIKPAPTQIYRKSLLPNNFHLNEIKNKFSKILSLSE